MYRFDIINLIAPKIDAVDYLEIGVNLGQTFERIIIKNKDGVDPEPLSHHTNFRMTSDKFFDYLHPRKGYDIVFIDGLHIHEQAYRDFLNSFNHLNPGGFILFHDTNPPSKDHAGETQVFEQWNGNVYQTIMKLRSEWPNLTIFTVETDWGVTIVQKGFQKTIEMKPEDYNYEFFDLNRKEILNLISVEEFIQWVKSL